MPLPSDSLILLSDWSEMPIQHLRPDDQVLAYDFGRHDFRAARVIRVLDAGYQAIFRFRHDYGIVDCTRSHKVCGCAASREYKTLRMMYAVRGHCPIVVRSTIGAPALSHLSAEGFVCKDNTWVVLIDHPDAAIVCNGLVLVNQPEVR